MSGFACDFAAPLIKSNLFLHVLPLSRIWLLAKVIYACSESKFLEAWLFLLLFLEPWRAVLGTDSRWPMKQQRHTVWSLSHHRSVDQRSYSADLLHGCVCPTETETYSANPSHHPENHELAVIVIKSLTFEVVCYTAKLTDTLCACDLEVWVSISEAKLGLPTNGPCWSGKERHPCQL